MLPTVTAISPYHGFEGTGWDRGMPQVSWSLVMGSQIVSFTCLAQSVQQVRLAHATISHQNACAFAATWIHLDQFGSIWIKFYTATFIHLHPLSLFEYKKISIWRPQRSALKSSTPWPSNALTKSTCTWTAHELHKLKSPLKKRLVTDPLIDWQATFNLGHILSQTCSLTSTPTDSHC